MAITELGELSDDEWPATTKAVSMPATMQMPPEAARARASHTATEGPGRLAGVLTGPR